MVFFCVNKGWYHNFDIKGTKAGHICGLIEFRANRVFLNIVSSYL